VTPQNAPCAARAGVATGEPDLWCTYAAIRTLAWLGRLDQVPDRVGTLAYLASRRNADGGYSWSRGMASDAWATFYCMQALRDLGDPLPQRSATADWLGTTFADGAYAMMPGQAPDVWATHFSTRTAVELCRAGVPDAAALGSWLGELQTADGGLSWSPAHARAGEPDVRASHYGIRAWRALRESEQLDPPWDLGRLVRWIQGQQMPGGGFRFSAGAAEPCMWATFRASAALRELNQEPARPADAVDWIMQMRGHAGSFVRWSGYPVEDVWAAFCAIGALRALGQTTAPVAGAVAGRLRAMACPGGGFTYCEPQLAADALTTAAAIMQLPAGDPRRQPWLAWLDACQLPNEGGVMYMPARGAEIRCTLWALAAGALSGEVAQRKVAAWLAVMQNPDGGFGYWEGRGSDLVSTAAAIEIAVRLGHPVSQALDARGLAGFLAACERPYQDGSPGAAPVPGGEPGLRAGLQAARIRAALGQADMPQLVRLLERHRVRGGGYANVGSRFPDLVSTYDALATAGHYGLTVDRQGMRAFLDRVTSGSGAAWNPLCPGGGGPLADCLASLIAQQLEDRDRVLPVLTLS
jgi:hypothetical protein